MLEKKPLPSVFRVTALVISQILYFLQSVLRKRIRIRGLRPTASPRTLALSKPSRLPSGVPSRSQGIHCPLIQKTNTVACHLLLTK